MLLFGFGMGLNFVTLTLMAVSGVAQHEAGAASGLLNATPAGGRFARPVHPGHGLRHGQPQRGREADPGVHGAGDRRSRRREFAETQQLPAPWGHEVLAQGISTAFIAGRGDGRTRPAHRGAGDPGPQERPGGASSRGRAARTPVAGTGRDGAQREARASAQVQAPRAADRPDRRARLSAHVRSDSSPACAQSTYESIAGTDRPHRCQARAVLTRAFDGRFARMSPGPRLAPARGVPGTRRTRPVVALMPARAQERSGSGSVSRAGTASAERPLEVVEVDLARRLVALDVPLGDQPVRATSGRTPARRPPRSPRRRAAASGRRTPRPP